MYLLIAVIITELSSSFGWKWKQWKPLRTSLFGRFYWIKLLKPPRERTSCMAFHCGPPVSLKEANGSLEALITSSWEPLQRQVRAFSTSIGINLKKYPKDLTVLACIMYSYTITGLFWTVGMLRNYVNVHHVGSQRGILDSELIYFTELINI